jgi:tetratricopeptide (TPR) repeat protein
MCWMIFVLLTANLCLSSGRCSALAVLYRSCLTCSYGRCWDVILRALSLTQECVLAAVLAIDFWLARNDMKNAAHALHLAKSLGEKYSAVLSQRERAYLEGFSLMMENKLRAAFQLLSDTLDTYPQDLFLVKKVQLLAFVMGGRKEMLEVTQKPAVVKVNDKQPYFHGILAFALQENEKVRPVVAAERTKIDDICIHSRFLSSIAVMFHPCSAQFDEALTAAKRGLEMNPHDPWALHACAHVFYAKAQLLEGFEWLLARSSEWSECMSFLYQHCWFHAGLLALDLDRYTEVLQIFDIHVWPWKREVGAARDASHNNNQPSAVAEEEKASKMSPEHEKNASEQVASPKPLPTSSAVFLSSSDPNPSLISLVSHPLPEVSTSFGAEVTQLSFVRYDRFYPEDQNGAINLLWRLELRWAGKAAGEASAATAAAAGSAEALPSGKKGTFSFFDSRWRSIASSLTLPPIQPMSLYGLLQLYTLCRVGRMEQAREFVELLKVEVEKIADANRKQTLKGNPQTRSIHIILCSAKTVLNCSPEIFY